MRASFFVSKTRSIFVYNQKNKNKMLKDFSVTTAVEIAVGGILAGAILYTLSIVLKKYIDKAKGNFESESFEHENFEG